MNEPPYGPLETPIVAHYRYRYLGATETFIHEVVRRQRRYRPVVLAHVRQNEERFPVPDFRLLRGPGGDRVLEGLKRSVSASVVYRRLTLARALRDLEPRLVHAHFGDDAAIALAPARRRGIPLVASFYGIDAMQRAAQWRWRPLIRGVLERAALLLVEGPHLRRRLLDLGAVDDRVRIQPIPIRLELFPYRAPRPTGVAGDPDGGPVILVQACRFVQKKGVDLSIRALARLGPASVELRLIGDGPERASLEALAAELGVGDRVRFLGMKSHEEYAEILHGADLFIHPSRTAADGDGEGGAPTVLLEAQAVGLPIVASSHADIPFVVDPDAALLSAEEDVEGLAAHVRHLLDHPEEWERRARAGRAKVAEQHEPARLVRRLEELYDEVLERGP